MPANRTILIAEDVEEDLEMLLRAFQFLGVQNPVQTVKDGQQVLDYFGGRGIYSDRNKYPIPGILMLDIQMPKRNGLEVLHCINRSTHYSELLVVVLTGLTDNHYIDKAYLAGAHSFLRKPVKAAELQNLATFYNNFWLVDNDDASEAGAA
jgi:CheY-like chemotaxis protein